MTSKAVVPPQTIELKQVIIRIVEGKIGQIHIEGNRYFKDKLIKRRMERSQLMEVGADIYVLLLRNRLDANLDAFLQVAVPIDLRESSAIDHVYVIVRGQLVEL